MSIVSLLDVEHELRVRRLHVGAGGLPRRCYYCDEPTLVLPDGSEVDDTRKRRGKPHDCRLVEGKPARS